VKSLEDRIAFLEAQLPAHGLQDIQTSSPAPISSEGTNTGAPSGISYEAGEETSDLVGQIASEYFLQQPFFTNLKYRSHDGLSMVQSLLSGQFPSY
jgi:hypothetical protein